MDNQKLYRCPDGRKTISFKEVFYENLLKESPSYSRYDTNMEQYDFNVEETKDIVKYYNYIGDINVSGVNAQIYQYDEGDSIDYYMVTQLKSDLLTVSRSSLSKRDNIVQITLSWNKKGEGKLFYWNFFNSYLIREYDKIISDVNLTENARDFWEDVVIKYNEETKNMFQTFIYNIITKETNILVNNGDIPDDFWGNTDWVYGIERI